MSAPSDTIILYGSYGYTGNLIAAECRSRERNVILSGRNRRLLEKQSLETGYPFQVVELTDSPALHNLLEQGRVVIHCAGPFQFTARTMIEACLATKTHYLDITGEYQVFEMAASYDALAKEEGITILPGTGFDVVPSDCLALFLKNLLPAATRLELAFVSGGGLSRGTAKTMVHGLGLGSVVRKNGVLKNIPLGQKIKDVDFGKRKVRCLNIPWGDVSSAWYSTGIPDIEVYMAASRNAIVMAKISRYLNWLLKGRRLRNVFLRIIDNRPNGPGAELLNTSGSILWGSVYDDSGNSKTAVIETLGGYKLTSKTSVRIAEYILAGNFRTGFQTPATAYGPDLILSIEKTRRTVLWPLRETAHPHL